MNIIVGAYIGPVGSAETDGLRSFESRHDARHGEVEGLLSASWNYGIPETVPTVVSSRLYNDSCSIRIGSTTG